MSDKKTNFSDEQITKTARELIKHQRDCFYGDEVEHQRLKKIRESLDKVFVESYEAEEG
jgi:hypothetical protein